MNQFPLQPFLDALKAEGIRVTIADYHRIMLVLSTGGPWTIGRLRDVLMSLLAKSTEEREIFRRCYDAFFAPSKVQPPDVQAINVDSFLQQAKELTEKGKQPPPPPPPPRKRFIIISVALVAVVSALILVWKSCGTSVVDSACRPKVPIKLPFPSTLIDSMTIDSLTISDTCQSEFTLRSIAIVDPQGRTPFKLAVAESLLVLPLAAGESRTIPISFTPRDTGSFQDVLKIKFALPDSQYLVRLSGTAVKEADSTSSSARNTTVPTPTTRTHYRRYHDVPAVIKVTTSSLPIPLGIWLALLSVMFFITAIWFAFRMRRAIKVPVDRPPLPVNPDQPVRFNPAAIGYSGVTPWLDHEVLDYFSDALGHFVSEETGRWLDMPKTINATIANCGLPSFVFGHKRRNRSLIILEDHDACARRHNPVAAELAAGMRVRGVPVVYGRFTNVPDIFTIEDGTHRFLDDFEDGRNGYLLCIFTDGKNMNRHTARYVLEMLGRWPSVAWFDPRESRFWDATTRLPVAFKIPLFPATAAGIRSAASMFLTERATRKDYSSHLDTGGFGVHLTGANMSAYVEHFLGDALLLAQDCAMMPVFGLELAHRLRREFYTRLPAERVNRILELPGTTVSVGGVTFSEQVLAILRRGFVLRRSTEEQERILRFLLQVIKAGEPPHKDSLEHLSWEAIYERVRLELDPDTGLERIGQLAQSPVGAYLASTLEKCSFPGETEGVPLRKQPANPHSLQRLARIGMRTKIPQYKRYPIPRWKWVTFLALVIGWLSSAIVGAVLMPENICSASCTFADLKTNAGIRLEEKTAKDKWRTILDTIADERLTTVHSRFKNKKHLRLSVFASGLKSMAEFDVPTFDWVDVVVGVRDTVCPCEEEKRDEGILIERCSGRLDPDTFDTPRWFEKLDSTERHSRNTSLALILNDTTIFDRDSLKGNFYPALYSTYFEWQLLENGSIDQVFRVYRDKAGNPPSQARVDSLIDSYIGPVSRNCQLVWWNMGPNTINTISHIGRYIRVDFDTVSFGFKRIQKLLAPGKMPRIEEEEIARTFKGASLHGPGPKMVWFRPQVGTGTLRITAIPQRAEILLVNDKTRDSVKVQGAGLQKLTAGLWHVGATAKGYQPLAADIAVTANKQKDTTIVLIPDSVATVIVTAKVQRKKKPEPVPAEVIFTLKDGGETIKGKSGVAIKIRAGTWSLISSFEEFETKKTMEFKIEGGESKRIALELFPKQDAKTGLVSFRANKDGKPVSMRIVITRQDDKTDTTVMTNAIIKLREGRYRWAVLPKEAMRYGVSNYAAINLINVVMGMDTVINVTMDTTAEKVDTNKPLERQNSDTSLYRLRMRIKESHADCIVFFPDGKTLALPNWDKTVTLWDLETGTLIHSLKGHPSPVLTLAISPDGKMLASAGYNTKVDLWDLETYSLIRTLTGHKDAVNSIAISPDGKTLASASTDKTVKVWDLETDTLISTLTGHKGAVNSIAISPDGKILASASWDNTVKLWDLETDTLIRILTDQKSPVNSVAFSPKGKILASAHRDKTVKLWHLQTGILMRTLTGHKGDVISIAISPDGITLASASEDETVKLWNLLTGKLKHTFALFPDSIDEPKGLKVLLKPCPQNLAFSPDGKTLAISTGKDIQLWSLSNIPSRDVPSLPRGLKAK
jgi:hypothetical protein